MAYDEGLAQRVRELCGDGLDEKKMFGGLGFFDRGNMAFGVMGDLLMVRVGPEIYESALSQPHVREMDFTGRPMRGMIYVDPPGIEDDDDLQAWLEKGLKFTSSLPAK
ncbi:MAG: TfoX/Sxy family protein [Candidatus Marinimicrobia bacterium]|nr:TfoX/Sxy family protein [Candidatus Neomarinimicrobiota bacterium]